MNGTNHSTPGLARITRWDRSLRFRLLFFVAILLLGALAITGLKTRTWRRVERLHEELAGIQTNGFELAMLLSAQLRELNDTALACHFHPDLTNRNKFFSLAKELDPSLAKPTRPLSTPLERQAFQEFVAAYHVYRSAMDPLLLSDKPWSDSQSFGAIHDRLEAQVQPVLLALNLWTKAQNEAFDALVQDSQRTLLDLLRPLKLSLVLLWSLAAFLAVLGYRGMIAPLLTRLDQSRALIARQEKLASLGVLAAGVAHEIRNPLTAIKFRLFSLNQSLPQTVENEDAKVICGEINRLDRIVKEFLQFARPSDPKLVSVPAERLLQQVCDLLKSDLEKRTIHLQLEQSGTTWVQADPQQIEQVLINLVQNAADSIGEKGAITLRVREGNAGLGGQIRSGTILEVADTGKGIAPEVEKRLFDPFFTTKDGGTGLGLAIAAELVRAHGGEIRLVEGTIGATLRITIPDRAVELSAHRGARAHG